MVRTEIHEEDEETRDSLSPAEESKRVALRSKHSETEQRRRSKINERFQILRGLIPENDQKRDKASLLLEVIQYIQFLHEKLRVYEGSCRGWSPETLSLPGRINSGPVECFLHQSQLQTNLSGPEDDDVAHQTLLSDVQNSLESDLVEAALCTSTTNTPMTTKSHPVNVPLQTSNYEGVTGQPLEGSFPNVEQLSHQPQSHFWHGRSGDDSSFPFYAADEELKTESGESSFSNACSQDLLNSLKNALQSSGVDLSQASISVQLDIGKGANSSSKSSSFDIKDHERASYGTPKNIDWSYEHLHKRFRSDES